MDLGISGTATGSTKAVSSTAAPINSAAARKASGGVGATATRSPAPKASASTGPKKAVGAPRCAGPSMRRASVWSEEVEDLYRLQTSGWKDVAEYTKKYGEPERHVVGDGKMDADYPYISKLQLKANGFFVYWKKHRECTDGELKKVKIYEEQVN